MRIGVMQGSLQDFDLASVLQVVGLGRQYTGVRVELDNGFGGTVYMKAGHVVSVDAPNSSGLDALTRLFSFDRGHFAVFRSETPAQLPEPIGALRRLLADVQARAKSLSAPPPPVPVPAVAAPAVAVPAVAVPAVVAPAVAVPAVATPAVAASPVAAPAVVPVQATVPSEPAPAAPAVMSSSAPRRVEASRPDSSARAVVAVASPKGGCGKSTIALNLALGLARRGTRVLLIDADVNSDVLSALDARTKARVGALDIIVRGASLDDAVLETALTHLAIVPAVGAELVDLDALEQDHRAAWKRLLDEAANRADVVLIDTPAGMGGTTRHVLSGCTHVLGVLQAESIAQRSFERFHQSLEQLTASNVQVLGVVLNMLQMRHPGSFSVFQEACREQLGRWLFDTTIPRHPSFLDAALEGLPLRPLDEQAPGAVGFLFDNLASEVAERLGLSVAKRAQRALLL